MKRTDIVNAAYAGRRVLRDLVEHGVLVTDFDVDGATDWAVTDYMMDLGFRWSARCGYWSFIQHSLPLHGDGSHEHE